MMRRSELLQTEAKSVACESPVNIFDLRNFCEMCRYKYLIISSHKWLSYNILSETVAFVSSLFVLARSDQTQL